MEINRSRSAVGQKDEKELEKGRGYGGFQGKVRGNSRVEGRCSTPTSHCRFPLPIYYI